VDKHDVVGLIGLALIVGGVWMVYHPAAFIVAGAVIFGYAFYTAKAEPTPAAAPKDGE
jgi:uncharacterized membrane protein HdeD (DUF308 family)